jgi:hypothetical protein
VGTLQNYVDDVQEIVHDITSSSWPLSRVIARINAAREDVSLDMHCVRSNITGIQLLPGQEVYDYSGAIAGATVTAGGAALPASPTIVFGAAPAGGVTATATGTAVGGVLTSITMTKWGAGYVSVPTITINGGVGGAAATPVSLINVFNVLSITNIWNTMPYTLSFRGFGQFQAWARWLAFSGQQSQPGIWTIHQGDQFVYIDPPPNQVYSSMWDCLMLANPLVNLSDVDSQVLLPWSKGVQWKAAEYLLYKHQNFGQVQMIERKYDRIVPRYIMGAGGIRVPNPYNRNFARKMGRT